MRVALWLLSLFAVAVAVASFAGDNQGTITLFWPPYRLDLSLNLVLLLLAVLFVTVHLALRSLAALFAMPGHARRWRIQHHLSARPGRKGRHGVADRQPNRHRQHQRRLAHSL